VSPLPRGTPPRLREAASGELLLAADEAQGLALLNRWLNDAARQGLEPWLRALAQETGLPCRGVHIRNQKTRWGSRSSRGAISLNRKLVFLPPGLCRYVLLHELAHAKHMNHSAAFWEALRQLEPRARELDAELRHGWRYVPAWAD